MSDVANFDLDLPADEPVEEQPVDEPVIELPVEPEVSEEEDLPLAASADEPDDDDDDEPVVQESRAQKRIRQEIDRRKGLETQLEQTQAQINQQRDQLQQLFQKLTADEQAKQPAPPDFDEDPAAHLLHNQERLQQQFNQQQEFTAQQQHAARQQHELNTVTQSYEAIESQFANANPDYYQRIEGLKNSRVAMWEGLGLTPAQAIGRVQEEALTVVRQGLQNGRNPAEVFYNMAGPAAVPVEQNVRQAAARQQRSTSLGSRGTARGKYTISDLSTMDASEFDKVTTGANWEKLLKSLGG